MKLSRIVDPNFKRSLNNLMAQPLPASLSWKLAKVVKRFDEEIQEYTNVREETLKKLADKDDAGNPIIKDNAYQLTDEAKKTLTEELNSLNGQEVELPATLKLSELDGVRITAQDMLNLDTLITE